MNYYALIYETVDDYVARRAEFREMHLRIARAARERGDLVLAGAFDDPVDRALLVFRVDDKSKVEEFARKDPYVVNGLVKKWEVRPWKVVVGHEQNTTSFVPTGAIVRHWSARTTEAQLPRYLEHFSKNVLPELRRVPGFLGANASVRKVAKEAEIFVETTWRSLDAIRGFAGPDLEAAVVAPEAAALLKDYDRRVRHYEIAISIRA
ncbi:MAG TPA: YciI-like protein [Candidatus Acidoferrum sp.]|nr:YciI-like protein [Candidatus Acidoferrum sp.]